MSAAQIKALRALADPIAARFDCDLEDVTVRQAGKRRLVRVIVDHDGGLPLDLVAGISRELSRALDDADLLGQAPYVLEVSSPGVDRPLTLPRHWARAIGRLVTVTPKSGEKATGRIRAADGSAAELDVSGEVRVVRYADVARAVVQVELKRVDEVDLDEADEGDPDGAATSPGDIPDEGEEA